MENNPIQVELQFVSQSLFKRNTQETLESMTYFFKKLHGSPICHFHSKIVHKRVCRPVKSPTPERDSGESCNAGWLSLTVPH